MVAMEIPGGKRNLNMNIDAQQVILNHTYQTIQVYIKFNLLAFRRYSGGSSVSQNKLPQLILGYIYILKYLQSNFIG